MDTTQAGIAGFPPELVQAIAQQLLLFDPLRRQIAEEQSRLSSEQLKEYIAVLRAKGDGKNHVRDVERRIRVMLRLCRAATCGHLTKAGIQLALAKLRAERPRRRSLGLASVNHSLNSIKGFCNWLAENDRAERSPARGLKRFPAETDIRRARRPLSKDEVLRLINAATSGPPIANIPGVERALMYALAVTTGLRAKELESLTRDSFHLDSGAAYVVIEARNAKSKRRKAIPLRSDVAQMIPAYFATIDRADKLFRRPPANGTRALRIDLRAAGIAYRLNGEYADFHSLRHTFVTSLFDTGCTPKVAQELARHQDCRMTMERYAHAKGNALRDAVEALPPTPMIDFARAGACAPAVITPLETGRNV